MEKQTEEQAIKEAVAKCPYREMCEKGFTVLMDGKLKRIKMLKPINDANYESKDDNNVKEVSEWIW